MHIDCNQNTVNEWLRWDIKHMLDGWFRPNLWFNRRSNQNKSTTHIDVRYSMYIIYLFIISNAFVFCFSFVLFFSVFWIWTEQQHCNAINYSVQLCTVGRVNCFRKRCIKQFPRKSTHKCFFQLPFVVECCFCSFLFRICFFFSLPLSLNLYNFWANEKFWAHRHSFINKHNYFMQSSVFIHNFLREHE